MILVSSPTALSVDVTLHVAGQAAAHATAHAMIEPDR